MKFVYAPEGAESREWDWEPGRIVSTEAELIERKTGMNFPAWITAVQAGSMMAMHALLFILLRRDNAALSWEQVVFAYDDVGWRYSNDDEARLALQNLEEAAKERDLNEGEAALLESLRLQLAEAEEHPESDGGDDEADPTPPPGGSGKKRKSPPGGD